MNYIEEIVRDRFNGGKIAISEGNDKLGKIPNFNLPPIKSCPNCSDCKQDCYANKYYIQYTNTRISYDSNLLIAKYKLGIFKSGIMAYLSKHRRNKITKFRIHSSGDYFSQAYFNTWIDIAKQFPSIAFFSYTKNYNLDISDIPDNFILRYSVFYNSRKDHDLDIAKAYTITVDQVSAKIEEGAYMCPCDCSECGFCSDLLAKNVDIYFPLH